MIHAAFFMILFLGPLDIHWTALPTGQISVECAGDVNGDGTEDCFYSFFRVQCFRCILSRRYYR